MKQRKTSFELLRIILIIAVVIYHLFLYNGVFYQECTPNAIYGLLLSASTVIPGDYAFITLSAYYLIPKKSQWNPRRFLSFAALSFTLYLLKMGILRGLFGYNNTEYFIELFLVTGAWWYVTQYLLLLLYYPLLNRLIHSEKPAKLYLCTAVLGILYLINGATNIMNFWNDLIMFLFTYLLVGCLYVHPLKWDFFTKHKRAFLLMLCFSLSLAMTAVCVYVKLPLSGIAVSWGNQFIQRIIGRYCFPAMIVGLSVFELFRCWDLSYSKTIHRLAKIIIYVFLMHETLLGIFWYFKKCWNTMAYDSTPEFFLWTVIYLIACFVFAGILQQIYTRFIEPLWNKLIDKICNYYAERKSSC